MILLAAFLLAAAPAYADLEPFMNEESAAHAFEAHIFCLGEGTFARQNDLREPRLIAAEVMTACSDKEAALKAALLDVYRRKPALIESGKDPAEAADEYVAGAQARVEQVIQDWRTHNK